VVLAAMAVTHQVFHYPLSVVVEVDIHQVQLAGDLEEDLEVLITLLGLELRGRGMLVLAHLMELELEVAAALRQ
jgi:hypothetical protein